MSEDVILSELQEKFPIENEVSFNEFNIDERLQMNGNLILKYKGLYNETKIKLDRMIEIKEKIVGERYDYYRFNYDRVLTKPEIEKYYLPKDEKIIKCNDLIRKQQIKVDFFEMCYKTLEKVGWNMKTFCELMRSGVI